MGTQYNSLMVIIPHALTDLVKKGEVTDRYYNPGDLFKEVHIVLTNNDKPEQKFVQRMVGNAKLTIHNVALGNRFFLRTLCWRPWLISLWARRVVKLADQIKPQLVRCYGAYFNGIAARDIKRKYDIPYVVSLHTNPDQHLGVNLLDRIQWKFMDSMAKTVLREADVVLPVYQGILPYLRRLNVKNIIVAYNVINPSGIIRKENFKLGKSVKVIAVGRHIEGKSPENIIRAVSQMKNIQLTIVGDGVLNNHLHSVAHKCGLTGNVVFKKSIDNDTLCRELFEHDIFAICNMKWGISKTVLEAFLTGIPVLINKQNNETVPEITSEISYQVENTPEGFCQGLKFLIENEAKRKELGLKEIEHAWKTWSPKKTEYKYTNIYKTILNEKNTL